MRSYESQGAKMLQIMQFLIKMIRICSFNISATTLYTAKYVLILLFQSVSDGSSRQVMSREALDLEKIWLSYLIFECVCNGQPKRGMTSVDAFFSN